MQDNIDSPIIFHGPGSLFDQAISQGYTETLDGYLSLEKKKSIHYQYVCVLRDIDETYRGRRL